MLKLNAAGVRRGTLFVGGLIGMIFEATQAEPRAILVGAYLLALGLPIFKGVGSLFEQVAQQSQEPPPPPPTPPGPTP